MGEENYVVQFIKSEQASIKRAERELTERKKRLNRFVKEHQSAINSNSSEKKTSQPCCRFHRCVNEKELALSLKDIYEMYFKSPVRKKLLSNYDSVSDFTAMLYIILVGCGVVINKQAPLLRVYQPASMDTRCYKQNHAQPPEPTVRRQPRRRNLQNRRHTQRKTKAGFPKSETLFPKIIFLPRNQRAVGQQRVIRQQPVIQAHTALSI